MKEGPTLLLSCLVTIQSVTLTILQYLCSIMISEQSIFFTSTHFTSSEVKVIIGDQICIAKWKIPRLTHFLAILAIVEYLCSIYQHYEHFLQHFSNILPFHLILADEATLFDRQEKIENGYIQIQFSATSTILQYFGSIIS